MLQICQCSQKSISRAAFLFLSRVSFFYDICIYKLKKIGKIVSNPKIPIGYNCQQTRRHQNLQKFLLDKGILQKFSKNLFFLICKYTFINISSDVEFQRWWVLRSKIFGQESTYSKEKIKKIPSMYDCLLITSDSKKLTLNAVVIQYCFFESDVDAKIVLSRSIFDNKN